MSAQLAGASAVFTYQGASVTLSCSSPTDLKDALATFGIGAAANDSGKTQKPPASSPAPAAAGNASASTGTQASAPAAGAGSAPSGGEATPITYNEIRDRVLALSKVSRDTAVKALAHFKVDHGNKLPLEQYAAFMAHTDSLVGAAK
jgi:hypothetical protein